MIFIYMDYIITNEKLFSVIYKFIDGEYKDDNLDWEYDTDYETDEHEQYIVNFFGDKYSNNEQDESYFQYVKKEYYLKIGLGDLYDIWFDKAPLLDFIEWEWCNKMNSLFGNYWKPVFEKWFKDTYPEFPVKTFIYPKTI